METKASAPASIALFGRDSDRLCLALAKPGNTVTVRPIERGLSASAVGVGGALATQHVAVATATAEALGQVAGLDLVVELTVDVRVPYGSLGSLEATAAASAMAVNDFLGTPLRKAELAPPCSRAAGVSPGHLAAAIHGGLVLVRRTEVWDLVRLPVPEGLWIVFVPWDDGNTATGGSRMREDVAVDMAAFVSACHSDNVALLTRAAGCGVDSVRGRGREALLAAADAGALGTCSDTGSLTALCRSQRSASEIARVMGEVLARGPLRGPIRESPADCPGVRRR